MAALPRNRNDAPQLAVKALILIVCCVLCIPFAAVIMLAGLVFAPYAVWTGRRDAWATASVALWGVALVAAQAHGVSLPRYALLTLPVLAALVAHAGAL